MKVTAIYGGSFDPVHIAHVRLAEWIACNTEAESVWVMPSRLNPLKNGSLPAPDADRLAMARLAFSDVDGVEVCDFEMRLPVPSYTIDTLTGLSRQYPDRKFVPVIGVDNWMVIDKWRNSQKIIDEYGLYVVGRPGYEMPHPDTVPANVTLLPDAPLIDVSSTEIRDLLRHGQDASHLLPPAVTAYIAHHHLYQGE